MIRALSHSISIFAQFEFFIRVCGVCSFISELFSICSLLSRLPSTFHTLQSTPSSFSLPLSHYSSSVSPVWPNYGSTMISKVLNVTWRAHTPYHGIQWRSLYTQIILLAESHLSRNMVPNSHAFVLWTLLLLLSPPLLLSARCAIPKWIIFTWLQSNHCRV